MATAKMPSLKAASRSTLWPAIWLYEVFIAALLQRSFDFFAVFAGFGKNFRLIQRQEFLVTHDQAASDHDGFDVVAFQRVGKLRINVEHRNRVWLIEADQNDVGFFPGFERTDLLFHVERLRALDGSHFDHGFCA